MSHAQRQSYDTKVARAALKTVEKMREPAPPLTIGADALDAMMPMHAVVNPEGVITHAGPTLIKILGGQGPGAAFFSLFDPRRPAQIRDLAEICAVSGSRFSLRLRDASRTPLIAAASALGPGQGVLVNLSFGISVIDAVARFDLSASDFAATDLALEMLYLVEANAAAMAESRKLNERLHGAKQLAEAEAMSDTLTGLQNRRALDDALNRLIRRKVAFTLMHVDLDYFKKVNDTLGHAAGDAVLAEVAQVLRDATRPEDLVARVGGDEFVLVLKGVTDQRSLEKLAERLISRLEQPIEYQGKKAQISASIGASSSAQYLQPDLRVMMHDADVALYASKGKGRGCFTYHQPSD